MLKRYAETELEWTTHFTLSLLLLNDTTKLIILGIWNLLHILFTRNFIFESKDSPFSAKKAFICYHSKPYSSNISPHPYHIKKIKNPKIPLASNTQSRPRCISNKGYELLLSFILFTRNINIDVCLWYFLIYFQTF